MIKTFDEYLSERLFNGHVARELKGDERLEKGVKVRLDIGEDVYLQDPKIPYDQIVWDIITSNHVFFRELEKYTIKGRENIKEGKEEYIHLIDLPVHCEMCIEFDELNDVRRNIYGDVSDEDYLAITHGILNKIRKCRFKTERIPYFNYLVADKQTVEEIAKRLEIKSYEADPEIKRIVKKKYNSRFTLFSTGDNDLVLKFDSYQALAHYEEIVDFIKNIRHRHVEDI